MNPDLLVVMMRDIARAERDGRCTQEYLAAMAEVLREAIATEEVQPRSGTDDA